mmetsp:Transcript_32097/g.76246  ORF Transcript_32097/g.76246 Transcript_32097/m.76246 type:complete len:281 (-) Transcript_32097:117-959(-)
MASQQFGDDEQMSATMHDIELFERQLQQKTLREELKHKAASIDATPAMVEKAISQGIRDFTTFNEPFDGPLPSGHTAELESPGQDDAQARAQQGMEDDEDRMPVARAPIQERNADVPFAPDRENLVLVLAIQHGSNFEGNGHAWKSGLSALVCNPFCLVRYGAQLGRGKTVRNSRSPVFHDSFRLHPPAEGPYGKASITIYSEEDNGMGTLIGSAEIDLGAAFDKELATSVETGFDQWLNLSGGVAGSLHVSLRAETKNALGSSTLGKSREMSASLAKSG